MANETVSQTSLTGQLRRDHDKIKDLFDRFESARGDQRERAAQEAVAIIMKHDLVEQTILYPACRKERSIPRDLVLRCEEAHHLVHLLLAELKMRSYGDRYFAKFTKLIAAVRDHIEEEEAELFPALERSGIDDEELGREMIELSKNRGAMIFRSLRTRGGAIAAAAVLATVGWGAYKAFSDKE